MEEKSMTLKSTLLEKKKHISGLLMDDGKITVGRRIHGMYAICSASKVCRCETFTIRFCVGFIL